VRLSRIRLAAAFALAVVAVLMVSSADASAAESLTCTGRTMAFVAHQDDNLLFMNPRLQSEFDSGRCVRTVFLTAGDDGKPMPYWVGREEGMEAAYAEMAGVADSWTAGSVTVEGQPLLLKTLTADPRISIVFMRLPDGNNGEGFPSTGSQSLMKLWASANPCGECSEEESTIAAIDHSAVYTYQGLIGTLGGLIGEFGPRQIFTQNWDEIFHGVDHPDHVATARFVRSAAALDPEPHRLVAFWDYNTESFAPNVTAATLAAKSKTFYTYAAHDPETCDSELACENTQYKNWLAREYVKAEETHGVVADAGYGQTVSTGQQVTLDGSASSAEGGGAVTYDWTQVGGPVVSLSDPHAVHPTFTMIGHPTVLTFALTATSGGTSSPPDEVKVRVPSSDPAPTAVVAPGSTVDSAATVRLNGSESWDPNSLRLTYEWTQTAGAKVTLIEGSSARPEFVAPAGPTSVSFSLVVSNGAQPSPVATVSYQVRGIAPSLAVPASATFQVGATGSVAVKATGSPTPTLAVVGELPAGLTFVDDGDGSATVTGTPSAVVTPPGTSRDFSVTVTATNGLGKAEGHFGLTVVNPPAVEPPSPPTEPAVEPPPPSPPSTEPISQPQPAPQSQPAASGPVLSGPVVAYGFVGRRVDLPVEASGAPEPVISAGGVPAGLELEADGAGRARLVGKPRERGVRRVTLTARNSAGTAVHQIRLVLEPLPELSRRSVVLAASGGSRASVRIGGGSIKSATCAGRLPAGASCRVAGRRVWVTGAPAAAATGAYRLRLRVVARAGVVLLPLVVRVANAR
jgi:LmbE family N-acetylglucosaminyl deacetylase